MDRPEINELVHLAETGGLWAMYRWVKGRINELSAQAPLVESIYLGLKQRSVGAAFMFAYVLPREFTPDVATGDLSRARTENPGLWVTGVAHILSDPILNRARRAFEAGDILCGLQRHYCAGAGPTAVMFTSFASLEEHLRSTRPGDDFMLVSVQQLAARDALLQPTANEVRRYLAANSTEEVLLLRTDPPPPKIEVIWDGRETEEDVEAFFQPREGLFAVPFTWEQDFFIDAKMPNEKGAVPLGGAY